MSDLMRPIPFADLVNWLAGEQKSSGRIFGLDPQRAYQPGERRILTPLGSLLGSATGPAAGPHTQLAQNILAAYLAGGRFIELKTVQIMDGQEIREAIAKPCINAVDEGYNVEWSTELTVEQALEEYIKAWFLCHVAMKEFSISEERDFAFNMSVGYTLEGIRSPKIDGFIEGLKNASRVKVFEECKEVLRREIGNFRHFTEEDLDAVSPEICTSLTLSTMHGCPKEEIESIVTYLLAEKELNVYLKCNPTLLGYEEARRLADALGFDYLSFSRNHFDTDLKFEEAVPMLEKLLNLAQENGRVFGGKLTNTFPVDIRQNELPGTEMYSSGRALLPLSVHVARKLSGAFGSRLPLAYSGGADALNIRELVEAGIQPVTVCTTLLKPGGYQRLTQIAEEAAPAMKREYSGPDAEKINALADRILVQARNKKNYREDIGLRKTESPLPLWDCFKAPCKDGGCPIHQDIPAYLKLIAEERYLEAMAVIARDNAMPATLGEICYHPCKKRCTRVDYDLALSIRTMKHLAVEKAMAEYISTLKSPETNGKEVLVIGAGVQGLSLAYYLSRAGFRVLVAEKKEKPFGILNNIQKDKGLTDHALELDLKLVTAYGAELRFNVSQEELAQLGENKDYILSTTGRDEGFSGARLTLKDKDTRLQAVYAMAAAKNLAGEIIAENQGMIPVEKKKPLEPAKIYAKRGILVLPETGPEEGKRCLSCNEICEVCTEVCPNRANITIEAEGFADLHQILHMDALCNECGNCATFCPHAGKPYLDKLTLFSSPEDFHDSANVGFCVEDDGVLVRNADRSEEKTAPDMIRDENIRRLVAAVMKNYPYLLFRLGGDRS